MAVIELLRVLTAPGCRDEFLARDAEVWTPALAAQEGFVSKEIWVSQDDPNLVNPGPPLGLPAQWKSSPSACSDQPARHGDGLQVSRSLRKTYDVLPHDDGHR